MLTKIFLLIVLVTFANAGIFDTIPVSHGLSYAAPAVHAAPIAVHAAPVAVHAAPVAVHAPEPYDAHPKYSFKYGVSDPHTGDHKTAEEERDGDMVHGSYSLVEPDGTTRVVKYTADHHNGFNAVVERTGKAVHPAHVVHSAPVHAAPAIALTAAHSPSFAYH